MLWYPPAETKIPFRSISSAFFSTNGDFEKTLCNYLGVDKCILGNSGRALLTLLLKALWEKDGRTRNEVLIPGYTCYSVAASVARAGLKINIYDLDPGSFNPDIDDLKKKIGPQTLAVICQHLFGIPTDIKGLMQIIKEKGSYVIEDAAQALGGGIDGCPLGTIGDFGFYSFGRGKSLPLGGGGALVGKDAGVLSGLNLKLRNKGYASLISTAVSQVMSNPLLYWIPEMLPLGLGETIFDPGFGVSAMPLVMKKLGAKFVAVLNGLNTHRRHIAKTYEEAFDDGCIISVPDESKSVYTRFPLMAGLSQIARELKRLGVRRMYPKAIVDEETIKPYLVDQKPAAPGASEIAKKLITLPTHNGITENLAKEIAQEVMTGNR